MLKNNSEFFHIFWKLRTVKKLRFYEGSKNITNRGLIISFFLVTIDIFLLITRVKNKCSCFSIYFN